MERDFQVIFCVFAGRKRYLEILHHYIQQCLDLNYMDEYHIMNFTRNQEDYQYVIRSYEEMLKKYPNRIFIHCNEESKMRIEKKIKNPPLWPLFYQSLGKKIPHQKEKESVIVKCDDDILFFDIHQFHFATFERYLNKQPFLMHANCINNGVCSYFHKESFPKIKEKLLYPKGGICGPIFQTPQLGYILQHDFIKSILQNSSHLSNFHLTKNEFITTRISINFCLFHSDDIPLLNTVSIQDEYDVSSRIPEDLLRPTLILKNLIACHHSYSLQERVFQNLPSLIPLYQQLTLTPLPNPTFPSSISLSRISFNQNEDLYEIGCIEGYDVREESGGYMGIENGKLVLKKGKTNLFEWNGKELCYQIYPITRYNTGENQVKNEMLYSKCLVDEMEKCLEYEDGYLKLVKWNEYLDKRGDQVYFSKERRTKWFFEKKEKETKWVRRYKSKNRWIYEDAKTKEIYQNEYAGWSMEKFKYEIKIEEYEIQKDKRW